MLRRSYELGTTAAISSYFDIAALIFKTDPSNNSVYPQVYSLWSTITCFTTCQNDMWIHRIGPFFVVAGVALLLRTLLVPALEQSFRTHQLNLSPQSSRSEPSRDQRPEVSVALSGLGLK